jgi:hypothetical protein
VTYIEELLGVIRQLHGVEAKHAMFHDRFHRVVGRPPA